MSDGTTTERIKTAPPSLCARCRKQIDPAKIGQVVMVEHRDLRTGMQVVRGPFHKHCT